MSTNSEPSVWPSTWWQPDWRVPAPVRSVLTTRAGGVSAAPWNSLNLGDHVGDDPAHVAHNRARLATALGVRPVYLRQVHGTRVVTLQPGMSDGVVADACVCSEPALACTIMVADCLPILFASRDGAVVAAAHAGWRGLCHGVVEAAFHALCDERRRLAGVDPANGSDHELAQDTLVWLGPCIGPQAFEVGTEVKTAFEAVWPEHALHFAGHTGGKWLADLAALARQRLQRLGLIDIHGNDGSPRWCTVANGSDFFSHRRDHRRLGASGRFAAAVWRA